MKFKSIILIILSFSLLYSFGLRDNCYKNDKDFVNFFANVKVKGSPPKRD